MKKGSLDISIQAIVIVVLGMTLLGLGLTFVRSQFAGFRGLTEQVQSETRDRIVDQLRDTGDKISFPRSISLAKNSAEVLTLGVQNVGAGELYYKINLAFDPTESDPGPGASNFKLKYDKNCLALSPAESNVLNINIRSPRTPGTFALRAEIKQFTDDKCATEDTLEPLYASKLSFVTVGGVQ